MLRVLVVASVLALSLAACGGSSMSLSEYAEGLEAVADDANRQFEVVDASMQSGTPTLAEAGEAVRRGVVIRSEFHAALEALDPPDEIADLHGVLVDVHSRILGAQQAWAAAADTAGSVTELAQSPEAEAYRAVGEEGVGICLQLQEAMDATTERAALADVSWLPSDMKDTVEVAFGCA